MSAARLLVPLLLLAACAAPAAAETPQARAACTPSVFQLCPSQALSGDREAAKRCLLKHLDHASLRCQAAVRSTLAEEGAPGRPRE
jgi:hypothetical protein